MIIWSAVYFSLFDVCSIESQKKGTNSRCLFYQGVDDKA